MDKPRSSSLTFIKEPIGKDRPPIVLRQELKIEIFASGSDEKEAREKLCRIRQAILDIQDFYALSWSTKVSEMKEPNGNDITKGKGRA